jgi:hypothetical protein
MVHQLDVPVARNDADKRDRHVLALAERLEQRAVLGPDQQRILLLVPAMSTRPQSTRCGANGRARQAEASTLRPISPR